MPRVVHDQNVPKRVVHVIGNGDGAPLYLRKPRKGLKLACNQIQFEVPEKWATVMVDFKMMDTLMRYHNGDRSNGLSISGNWVLGYRPKRWMEAKPQFHMAKSNQIREFYTDLPQYTWDRSKGEDMGMGYTNWNCGHMATHYAANRLRAEEIHLYGFDSVFDFNMNSFTDLVLESDRGLMNSQRLSSNWRPIWEHMFKEWPDVSFVFHHTHDKFKIKTQSNVSCITYPKSERQLDRPEDVDFDQLGTTE